MMNRLWVKVCGLTTEEGIAAAVAADVDAIGFIFAPSKRQVTPQRAAELARDVPAHIKRVAVMLHPAQSLFDAVWNEFRPDMLQTDFEDLATLRVDSECSVMPVLRTGREQPAALPSRILVEGPLSGAGQTADWQVAATLARRHELVLAGGLSPDNVAAAVRTVNPFGVDVSSGVESAPGVKDPAKIRRFVSAARN